MRLLSCHTKPTGSLHQCAVCDLLDRFLFFPATKILRFKFCKERASVWQLVYKADAALSSSLITHTKQLQSGIPLLSSLLFTQCALQLKGFASLPWRCGDNSRMSIQYRARRAMKSTSLKERRMRDRGLEPSLWKTVQQCDLFSLRSSLN